MKQILLTTAVLTLGLITAARAADAPPSSVHTITLPVLPPDLPDAPGRALVMDRCTQCHSTRNITMQPAFSHEVWLNEVTKMKKNYGAPIADDQVEEIVNYLVAIRGK